MNQPEQKEPEQKEPEQIGGGEEKNQVPLLTVAEYFHDQHASNLTVDWEHNPIPCCKKKFATSPKSFLTKYCKAYFKRMVCKSKKYLSVKNQGQRFHTQ